MTLSKEQMARAESLALAGWPKGYVGVPDEDALLIIQYAHACGRAKAEFVLAIERGEIDGDIEVVDAQELVHA